MMRAFLLDLDDTLYAERAYVDAGYAAVAAHLAEQGVADAVSITARLTYEHEKHGRLQVFNRLCRFFDLAETALGEWVEIYRHAPRRLELYPGATKTLEALHQKGGVAIVTDGHVDMQKAKIAALGVDRLVGTVIFPWEIGAPKPDPRGFELALERLGASPSDALLIGDDPYHDGEAARRLGVDFARVRTGRFGAVDPPGLPPAMHDLDSIADLADALDS